MKSFEKAINLVIWLCTLSVIGAALFLAFTQTISMELAMGIGGIAAALAVGAAALVNYRFSSYGGRFHPRYPNAR